MSMWYASIARDAPDGIAARRIHCPAHLEREVLRARTPAHGRPEFRPPACTIASIVSFGAAGLLAMACMAPAGATGIWDPGLLSGAWRSDYASPAIGTAAQPLNYALDCPFPQSPFALCPGNFVPIPGIVGAQPVRSFGRSNWVTRPGSLGDRFWLVSANVEPALDSNCNSGPPNQSEPVVAPFEGVFGVAVGPSIEVGRAYQNEVVLAVDLSHRPRQLETRPACQPGEFIPYLGFGVASERGSGGEPLALLGAGAAAPVLRFNYRLLDSNAEFFAAGQAVPARPRGQYSGMLVEAKWAGLRRWVWIDLLKAFEAEGASILVPWNWTIRESFYYPGAEIVFTSGQALRAQCGSDGLDLPSTAPETFAHRQPVAMRINLTRLYQCVGNFFSTPFATQTAPVQITGVQFFVEVGMRERDGLPGLSPVDYDSRLGVAIDSIDIVPAAGSPTSSDAELVDQLGRDLVGRDWSLAQRTRWLAQIAIQGRTAVVAQMLHAMDVRRTAIAAARLNLLALGWNLDRPAFERTLAQLRAGGTFAQAASTLAQDAAVVSATGALDDHAFVRLMFSRALGGELDQQPDAAVIAEGFGSIAYWTDRLRSGASARADVLLSAFRLATARERLAKEAQIVILYRTFFDGLPDSGGIGYWRTASEMPERLIEVLYYTPEYRRRFGG